MEMLEDINLRKSKIIKELFELEIPKGTSQKDFLLQQQNTFSFILSEDPDFFNDVIIESKGPFNYFTSSIVDKHSSEMFFSFLKSPSVFSKINIENKEILSVIENITECIDKNKIKETNLYINFVAKMVINYLKKDMSKIENKIYYGGNILSHIAHKSPAFYQLFKSEINKYNIKRIGIKKENLKVIENNFSNDKETFLMLIGFLSYTLYSKKQLGMNVVIKQNAELGNEYKELKSIFKDAFLLSESEDYNEFINDKVKIKPTKHKKKRI